MRKFMYDYVLVGRFRNKAEIRPVLEALREAGKSVYCFLDNDYDGHGIKIETHEQADAEASIRSVERLTDWQTNPTFRKIFDNDMQGLRAAEALILVFPAGLSAHMELGVAYGLGKNATPSVSPKKPKPCISCSTASSLRFKRSWKYPKEMIVSKHVFSKQKWAQMTIFEQMGNIGVEVSRSLKAMRHGSKQDMRSASFRALDLFEATAAVWAQRKPHRVREILLARDEFIKAIVANRDDAGLEEYFMQFALAARRRR